MRTQPPPPIEQPQGDPSGFHPPTHWNVAQWVFAIVAGLAACYLLMVWVNRTMAPTFLVFDAPNASITYGVSIIDRGELTGSFVDTSQGNKTRSYVRDSNGNITVFDGPDGSGSEAVSINNHGDVTGSWYGPIPRRFVWSRNGNFIAFDAPNAHITRGLSINDHGNVAGVFEDGSQSNKARGFLRNANGSITVFDGPTPGVRRH
jgi:hypothetical protein